MGLSQDIGLVHPRLEPHIGRKRGDAGGVELVADGEKYADVGILETALMTVLTTAAAMDMWPRTVPKVT
jgi:hypothetical protein